MSGLGQGGACAANELRSSPIDSPSLPRSRPTPPPTRCLQFNVGHQAAVSGAQGALSAAGWEGVVLGGNYVAGVALGKCIEYAYTYAQHIAQQLAATRRRAQ